MPEDTTAKSLSGVEEPAKSMDGTANGASAGDGIADSGAGGPGERCPLDDDKVVPIGPHLGEQAQKGASVRPSRLVDEIVCGGLDLRGLRITKVYARQEGEYAIYKAGGDVMIQYADSARCAAEQRKKILKLGTAKADLNALLAGMRERKREIYDTRMATALQQCLDDPADGSAREIMSKAYADALIQRSADGRIQYLIGAAVTASLGFAVMTVAQDHLMPFQAAADNLWLAGRAGVLGALLSIGIGIRNRTVAIDLYPMSNVAEGALRLAIGCICAGFLLMGLTSGIFPEVRAGDTRLVGEGMSWQAVIVVGFVAGFLERLVPDLLEKTGPQPPMTVQQTNTPAANDGRAVTKAS